MGIIAKLLGGAEKHLSPVVARPGTEGDAEAFVHFYEQKLIDLAKERELAEAVLAVRLQKREDLLLVDGSDDEIAALDREAAEKELLLERLERLEPILLDRLQNARAARQRAQWQADLAVLNETIDECARAGTAYWAAFRAHIAAREAAQRHGFNRELGATAFAPGVMSQDNFEQFLRAIERQRDPPRQVQRPDPPAPAPEPPKARPAPVPQPPPKPPRAPVTEERKGDNECRILVLRKGYETPTGFSCIVGDVVSVPVDVALEAARNCAAELVDMPAQLDRPSFDLEAYALDADATQETAT